MTVISLKYFVFLLASVCIYYVIPKKAQWVALLCLSFVYYFLAATPYTILFPLASAVLAYISTNAFRIPLISRSQNGKKWIAGLTFAAILINILLWFLLKGFSFIRLGETIVHSAFPNAPVVKDLQVAAALGMGYYTAQVIGYILDCYWGICEPQRNILKMFLFVSFFPQLIVGPISKYSQLECLYEEHDLEYQNLTFGVQRILWGLFKKLVLSERIAVVVTYIWADTLQYNGIWIWIAVLLYPLEIYTDFSGCMDIVLGSAELFDIHLPENFRSPFFSKNCQEFWQRWHITLGVWAKDHVYYPILKSKPILALGKWSKNRFHKRAAKLIPWCVGMGVLWFVMGFWHGSSRHIIGVSAYFWTILVLGEVFSPFLKKLTRILRIDENAFSWKLFLSIRTYIIYAVGSISFSAENLRNALGHFRVFFHSFSRSEWNPWILHDGSILITGITYKDINIVIAGLVVLLVVDILREKYEYARLWIAKQNMAFRWIVYLSLLFAVLILGNYGPAYDASSFIYGQF